jgi:hypothetical protein
MMSRLDWILAAASVVLASTTIYYGRVLHVERAERMRVAVETPGSGAHPDAAAEPAAMAPEQLVETTAVAVPMPPVSAAATGGRQEPPQEPAAPISKDPGDMAVARHRLAQLRTPEGRGAMVREGEQELRRMLGTEMEILPGRKLAGIGLAPEEIDRVVGPIVEYMLRAQERALECESDPVCDEDALMLELQPAMEAEMATLVGKERFERFRQQAREPQP